MDKHVMHSEFYQVTKEAADTLNRIRAAGGRLVCVGTTSVRTIETVADDDGVIHPGFGETSHFHQARRENQGGRRADYELPPAAEHAGDAGKHLCGPRTDVGRIPAGGAGKVSVLQLRGRDVHRIRIAKGLLMLKTLVEMAATIAAVPLYIHYLPGIACADMEAALQTGFALALLYLLLRPLARFLTGWLSCLSLGLSNILVDAGLVMLCAETHEGKLLGRGLPLCPAACSCYQRCPDASGRTVQKEEITEVQP